MFNKAERARREAAHQYHDRRYKAAMSIVPEDEHDPTMLELASSNARFHRKQAELWVKSVKAFDEAALRTAKLEGRK